MRGRRGNGSSGSGRGDDLLTTLECMLRAVVLKSTGLAVFFFRVVVAAAKDRPVALERRSVRLRVEENSLAVICAFGTRIILSQMAGYL